MSNFSKAPPSCKGGGCAKDKACDELQKELDKTKGDLDKANLAESVYSKSGAPEGYSRLSNDEIRGLIGTPYTDKGIQNLLAPNGSSYRAALYKNNETGDITLAFRGSTLAPEDWIQNGKQALGMEAEHFTRAKALAAQVSAGVEEQGGNFSIVGHSKGGGMAAAAGIATGTPTTTFNASGVHKNTVPGHDPSKAGDLISNYVVKGEVLNTLQDHRKGILQGGGAALGTASGAARGARGGWPGAILGGVIGGARGWRSGSNMVQHGAIPQSAGSRISIQQPNDWNPVNKHLMDKGVLPAMNNKIKSIEKKMDELGCEKKDQKK